MGPLFHLNIREALVMHEEKRLAFLLKYHANLTQQLTSGLDPGGKRVAYQLILVEKEIETLLFPDMKGVRQ